MAAVNFHREVRQKLSSFILFLFFFCNAAVTPGRFSPQTRSNTQPPHRAPNRIFTCRMEITFDKSKQRAKLFLSFSSVSAIVPQKCNYGVISFPTWPPRKIIKKTHRITCSKQAETLESEPKQTNKKKNSSNNNNISNENDSPYPEKFSLFTVLPRLFFLLNNFFIHYPLTCHGHTARRCIRAVLPEMRRSRILPFISPGTELQGKRGKNPHKSMTKRH